MSITLKDLKKSKDIVEKLLHINGENYNEWLHQQHQQYIEENQSLILEALSLFTGNDDSGEEKQHEKEEPVSKETILSKI